MVMLGLRKMLDSRFSLPGGTWTWHCMLWMWQAAW